MVKIEAVELIMAGTPEELSDKCRAFMLRKTEERKHNVAVSSVPFVDGIRARIPIISDKGFGVMYFFDDYELSGHEKGPAKHHPDEAEGASMVGPELGRKKRR